MVKRLKNPDPRAWSIYFDKLNMIKSTIEIEAIKRPFKIKIVDPSFFDPARNILVYSTDEKLVFDDAIDRYAREFMKDGQVKIDTLKRFFQVSSGVIEISEGSDAISILTGNVLLDLKTLDLIVFDPD